MNTQKPTIPSDKDFYKVMIPLYSVGLSFFIGILLFVSWRSETPFIEIIYGFWPFLVVIPFGVTFIFIFKLANKSKRKNKSMEKLENEFKKDLKLCIKRNLGHIALLNLNPDMNEMDVEQSGIIKKLLKNEAKDNDEFKFFLYTLLGLYSIKSENLSYAIENFQTAVTFKSDCIICKTWLAEAYELLGDATQAIKIYKEILAQNDNKDLILSDYFNEQIEIVTTKGPRKLPPMTGFRYVSY